MSSVLATKGKRKDRNRNPNTVSSSEKVATPESLLKKHVAEWYEAPEEERDLVARDLIYELVHLIERGAKMHAMIARAHLKSLYAKWVDFCRLTEVETDDGYCERYEEALFGSAVITLNQGEGKAFVTLHKMLWSKVCMEQFVSWVNTSTDERSKYYKSWIQ
jgi:hypothetical protein